ncbi:uncharacterized protein LOC100904182 isoform X1 [Galendromus occidentalis]|uniref:Uncharacterized protein LOC100904182 isoform X1 n=1 Tax=Galendromus occidentalis TaxID=34638 RepID=A0AAJ6VXU9_9ACAR|nr:uncharacterized protein LOC100904182 isoform X1 [Galendromus occidentalis]
MRGSCIKRETYPSESIVDRLQISTMKLQILLTLSCAALAWGQVGNADSYLDEVLENARNNPEIRGKIDPLRIDDISFKKGSASDIKVYGLLSLARSGPATLTDHGDGNFAIDANLGLNRVTGDGRYKYRALFRFKGSISAKVDNISCNVRIAISNGKAHLQNFSIGSMSGLKVTRFTGASAVFNWLAKWIINLVVNKNRGKIRGQVENGARQALATALEKVDINRFIPRQ